MFTLLTRSCYIYRCLKIPDFVCKASCYGIFVSPEGIPEYSLAGDGFDTTQSFMKRLYSYNSANSCP